MNFPFYIAKRYLFTKKSHHAINVISGVSVCGVALATLAMVCTLSVFNGFQDLVATMFTAFDPEIKITAANGKGSSRLLFFQQFIDAFHIIQRIIHKELQFWNDT